LAAIAVSGSCTPAHVAVALKGGAYDFLPKPVGHEELLLTVRAALATTPSPALSPRNHLENISAQSSAGTWSQKMHLLVEHVGASDAPVLVRGETGAGKEVFARALHDRSRRSGRPFLKINCAALPSELIESELFGYEKGAFTGALKTTPGKFELANRGTILLDEIGDMDFKLQAKLLQVLQDHEFLRLGAKETSRVDVRIMAATHCNLEDAIAQGKFREDLFYRLNILDVYVPPLRERKDEILGLAQFFVAKYAPGEGTELPQNLCAELLEHNWPGNVRELENMIRKYLVFRNVDMIALDLRSKRSVKIIVRDRRQPTGSRGEPSEEASDSATPAQSTMAQLTQLRKQAEVNAILAALNTTSWNRKRAAKLLNIHYKALLYKMNKLGVGRLEEDGPPLQDGGGCASAG
jgi:two-component system response regulator AtoC